MPTTEPFSVAFGTPIPTLPTTFGAMHDTTAREASCASLNVANCKTKPPHNEGTEACCISAFAPRVAEASGKWSVATPARILGFNLKSPTLRELLHSERFTATVTFTDDQFVQRDPDSGTPPKDYSRRLASPKAARQSPN